MRPTRQSLTERNGIPERNIENQNETESKRKLEEAKRPTSRIAYCIFSSCSIPLVSFRAPVLRSGIPYLKPSDRRLTYYRSITQKTAGFLAKPAVYRIKTFQIFSYFYAHYRAAAFLTSRRTSRIFRQTICISRPPYAFTFLMIRAATPCTTSSRTRMILSG